MASRKARWCEISTSRYSGVTLAETIMGNQSDFDEAYQAAAKAPSPQLYPKTLTVFLDASPSGKHRAVHAAALAQRWDAHLIGVHVVFAGVRLSAIRVLGHRRKGIPSRDRP